MRTKVGWTLTVVMGVFLLGASGASGADGVAQAGEPDGGPPRNVAGLQAPATKASVLAKTQQVRRAPPSRPRLRPR